MGIGTYIYNVAEMYTNIVETGGSLSYNAVEASVSCAEAICSTTATGWGLGLGAGLKKCAKYSLGFKDYQKAIEAFRKKPPILIPNAPGTMILDMRPIGQRVGECAGHAINGGCKAVTTGVFATGTAAVIGGAISNFVWPEGTQPSSNFGQFHTASRHLAKGVLEVAKCMAQVGWAIAEAGVKATLAAGKVIASNPNVAFKTAGVGGLGYLTCRQIVEVGNAESYTRKAYHSALATIGVGSMAWLVCS